MNKKVTIETIIEGGILITLIFIGGVLWKTLKAVNDIADVVEGGSDTTGVKHPRQP